MQADLRGPRDGGAGRQLLARRQALLNGVVRPLHALLGHRDGASHLHAHQPQGTLPGAVPPKRAQRVCGGKQRQPAVAVGPEDGGDGPRVQPPPEPSELGAVLRRREALRVHVRRQEDFGVGVGHPGPHEVHQRPGDARHPQHGAPPLGAALRGAEHGERDPRVRRPRPVPPHPQEGVQGAHQRGLCVPNDVQPQRQVYGVGRRRGPPVCVGLEVVQAASPLSVPRRRPPHRLPVAPPRTLVGGHCGLGWRN
mmetsp:Transcript_79763/g.159268  ORF Transcript_79763/g.159268 Transcript_79763/m.159268 type:complete len:252 (-) Transcript_79763:251-1006(-)